MSTCLCSLLEYGELYLYLLILILSVNMLLGKSKCLYKTLKLGTTMFAETVVRNFARCCAKQ